VCALPTWLSLYVRVCRLHTIIDCDMVLVMDNGSAAEWGRPSTLLEDPNGTFSSTRRLCSPAIFLSAFQVPVVPFTLAQDPNHTLSNEPFCLIPFASCALPLEFCLLPFAAPVRPQLVLLLHADLSLDRTPPPPSPLSSRPPSADKQADD